MIIEEFLRVFPRRDGDHPRAPTLAAWRRAVAAGADPARIVAGAKAYAASVAGRERRFVVSAARYLAEERWPQAAPARARADRGNSLGFRDLAGMASLGRSLARRPRARARPSTPKAAGDFRPDVPPRRSNRRRNSPSRKENTAMKTNNLPPCPRRRPRARARRRASRNHPRERASGRTHSRGARGA